MSGVPRLKWPPQLVGPTGAKQLATVEQDSDADIDQCVVAILQHHVAERVDVPEMGVTDPTFAEAPADVRELTEIVTRHEPRVSVTATSAVDRIEQALTHLDIQWQSTRTQEGPDRG